MKDLTLSEAGLDVTPVSAVAMEYRVNAFTGAGIWVKNTGANPVSVWIETRQSDTATYAPRPIEDLVNIPAGEARQFDADISLSQWVGLLAQSSGGVSTIDVEILLSQGPRPW